MVHTCHGEQCDQHICKCNVEEDGLAPLLSQAALSQHQGVQGKTVANQREDEQPWKYYFYSEKKTQDVTISGNASRTDFHRDLIIILKINSVIKDKSGADRSNFCKIYACRIDAFSFKRTS